MTVQRRMQRFTVIPTDDGQFQVVRWNDVSQEFESQGRLFPTQELAEIVARNSQEAYDEEQEMYDEEQEKQDGEKMNKCI